MLYKEFIEKLNGIANIDLSAYKENQMKRRIEFFMARHRFSGYENCLHEIRTNKDIHDCFMNFITINVSEFFRNNQQWITLQELIKLYSSNKKSLKFWSAACSTGEEPYSLSIILSNLKPKIDFRIYATDIDKYALAKAKSGQYPANSVSNLPFDYIKYFTQENGIYKINDDVKSHIKFCEHDLIKDIYINNVDFVLCRNVVIYFTEEIKEEIYKKLSSSLTKGGILFVGNTEQIFMPERYGFKHIKSFFYEKI